MQQRCNHHATTYLDSPQGIISAQEVILIQQQLKLAMLLQLVVLRLHLHRLRGTFNGKAGRRALGLRGSAAAPVTATVTEASPNGRLAEQQHVHEQCTYWGEGVKGRV